MEIRKCLKYPPFYYLCYVKISGKDIEKQLSDAIKKNSNSTNKDKGKKVINVDDLY